MTLVEYSLLTNCTSLTSCTVGIGGYNNQNTYFGIISINEYNNQDPYFASVNRGSWMTVGWTLGLIIFVFVNNTYGEEEAPGGSSWARQENWG